MYELVNVLDTLYPSVSVEPLGLLVEDVLEGWSEYLVEYRTLSGAGDTC